MKRILMGIGSGLRGDDGIGNAVAGELKKRSLPNWISLACETVPENFAGVVEREKPWLLVIVDAAEMSLAPGEMRLLPKERLNSTTMGTHGLPLRQLVERLEKSAGKVLFIGVQPSSTQFGESLSQAGKKAVQRLLETVESENWDEIRQL